MSHIRQECAGAGRIKPESPRIIIWYTERIREMKNRGLAGRNGDGILFMNGLQDMCGIIKAGLRDNFPHTLCKLSVENKSGDMLPARQKTWRFFVL